MENHNMKLSHRLATFGLFLAAFLLTLSGCGRNKVIDERPVVSVTNSWLECAVKDIAGDKFRIVRLLPPGHCPGHFDLSPKQLEDIRNSAILMRFHFQAGMDEAFGEAMPEGSDIFSITIGEGQCLPETYLSSARGVKEKLAEHFPEDTALFDENYAALETRMKELATTAQSLAKDSPLEGTTALCSVHQAYFARWLGLEVIAEFNDLNDVPPSAINDVLQKVGENKVDLVIGNLQGGPAFASALAERFNTTTVVLSNFPSMQPGEDTFDKLVLNNLDKLIKAVEK